MTRICDCCGERQAAVEALAHGHAYCESCAVDSDPQCECGRPADPRTYDRPLYLWSDHSSVRCSECLQRAEYRSWADAMCARLEAAALAGGWEIEDVSHAETGSIYYTFWRRSHALDDLDLDEDEIEDGDERIVVRISDHASAYCREDYSLTPDGLEHDADEVLARIAARA